MRFSPVTIRFFLLCHDCYWACLYVVGMKLLCEVCFSELLSVFLL
jgi:hypothetical protein